MAEHKSVGSNSITWLSKMNIVHRACTSLFDIQVKWNYPGRLNSDSFVALMQFNLGNALPWEVA